MGQIIDNSTSFTSVKNFIEARWSVKGFLETQNHSDDLFVFRFQSVASKQEILEKSFISFGNRILFLWLWVSNKSIEKLKLDAFLFGFVYQTLGSTILIVTY